MTKLLLCLLAAGLAFAQTSLESLNVVWDSPSKDSSGSMPLGNGDIGLNAWVEESGDLVFYISKTDAWSESVRLLKIGRVRVRLSPNPFEGGAPFKQTLDLAKGEIVITGGRPEARCTLHIWVDANNPVIRVEAESKQRVNFFAFYERWRDQLRHLEGVEAESAYGLDGGPEPIISYPDSIVMAGDDRVAWYHRNAKSAWPGIMQFQGLSDFSRIDPLLDRTFGALMMGDGLTRMNPTALRTHGTVDKQALSIFVLTATSDTGEAWVRQVEGLAGRLSGIKVSDRRAAHDRWWQQFWDRSYIRAGGNASAEAVTKGYALQRFITACAGRGASPIKFNGSIFTVDTVVNDTRLDADYRRWGGPYWFQNTRLIYWPMLANGDFEMMQPLFKMYFDDLLMAKRRTRGYFDHDGIFFPETMYFWGAYANSNYGWKRAGKPVSWVENTYIRHYYSGVLELLAMMLDYAAYTQDKDFTRDTLSTFATEVIRFYDAHYKRDDKGKILFEPAQSLETWQEVINPLPEIAGTRYVFTRVLQEKVPLDRKVADTARRFVQALPDVPVKVVGSRKLLAPAEKVLAKAENTENPELYAIFPYRLYGLNKPEYEMARNSFEAREPRGTGGWRQDAIWAAYIGDAVHAREYVVENFTKKNEGSRFPAFFGPNYDWVPDQDQGGVSQIALQSMLIQSEGDKIVLFPAWPKDWDVDFKLVAPKNTIIEGSVRNGEVQSIKVTPPVRIGDIVRLSPQ